MLFYTHSNYSTYIRLHIGSRDLDAESTLRREEEIRKKLLDARKKGLAQLDGKYAPLLSNR